jgi:hypothetical protein
VTRHRVPILPTLCFAVAAGAALAAAARQAPSDPIAEAVASVVAAVAAETSSDQLWIDNKAGIEAALKDAQTALAAGRRWFALERLGQARQAYLATRFALQHPTERKDLAALERTWQALGATLGAAAPQPPPFEPATPAAARGLAEVALAQVRINYDAGLEYGRNTQPEFGLYYVGVGDAQRQFVTLVRSMPAAATPARTAPAVRSIASEIAGVQSELLSLYRPPASVDRHAEFIAASSSLKEARQYDAQGLRYGAMYKFLQGALRTAVLRSAAAPPDPAALATQLQEFRARLTAGRVDHTLGLLFLERAEAALETGTPATLQTAAATSMDVLPRYFAALDPLRPAAASRTAASPVATVTLVRWPFT